MRKLYLFVTLLLASSVSFAAPVIKTTCSSNWSSASILDLNRLLQIVDAILVTHGDREVTNSIKSIKAETSSASEIKIAGIQNKVLLQFFQQINGYLAIRFVSASGQIIDQQNINNPVRQVVLNSKVTGNYIISISNGRNINTSKQVIL